MKDSKHKLIYGSTHFPALRREALTVLQVNLGYLCNQSCSHCHVNAGPNRTELMDLKTIETVLAFIRSNPIELLDLTGGAPELNPHFRTLVVAARKMGVKVMDRCNLTILQEPSQEDLADFLMNHEVEITASLPCYLAENVDKQRGSGVFGKSIKALQQLNRLGYGKKPELPLNLVYNPQGPNLPPNQAQLQASYKDYLFDHYQIQFTRLFALTNMPIARFAASLTAKGIFEDYLTLLQDNFNSQALPTLMCRHTLSVDWQGYVYDCDFNQMLSLPAGLAKGKPLHLSSLLNTNMQDQTIRVADHCFGCTAGQGSSCQGATA